ncbi:MAG: ABC transporter permease [Anaeromicrobium sp.]|uniref:ABC transporter permease n=1 Tax=Anaeromicrobium sp. TaxID=1929132 RepID=UPI0025DD95E8|nr:ABC transporter permease [Anaeromicrobium sp.]MCT4595258.1 ABC transporter permease [Anaeromicrobium sp.]
MESLFEMILNDAFWFAVIRATTPILFATLGAVVASRAGAINIGIEGTMLTAALMGVIFSAYSQSVWIGLMAAVIAGIILSIVLAYFAFKLKSNLIVTGIAINIFSAGGTVFLLSSLTGDKGTSTSLNSLVLPNIHIPIIEDMPVVGSILSGHNILTYVGLVSIIFMYILFNHMSLGLRIKAVGESPEAAESVGIDVFKIKFISLCMSGVFAGLGGAFLSMGYVSWFSAGMTAGRGYIALAARAIAGNTSIGALLASLLFGFADTLSNYLQAFKIPVEFIHMTPYIMTIVGFIVISIVNSKKEINRKKKMMNE